MFKTMSYKEIEEHELSQDYIFIDLRSEGEYSAETIPGAINIPILNNEERKIVGTTYKQKDIEKAKLLGLEFVGKKLPEMYKQRTYFFKGVRILIHSVGVLLEFEILLEMILM